MTKIDIAAEKQRYDVEIQKLLDKYGNATLIPKDEWYAQSERLRAAYCLYTNPELTPQQVFKTYSVDQRVWSHFVDGEIISTLEKRQSRSEKIQSVLNWAAENVGEQVDLEKIQQANNIAYTMAKKISEDRPDVFRRVKRGLFEIRDPEADRKADREAAAQAKAAAAADLEQEASNDDSN